MPKSLCVEADFMVSWFKEYTLGGTGIFLRENLRVTHFFASLVVVPPHVKSFEKI